MNISSKTFTGFSGTKSIAAGELSAVRSRPSERAIGQRTPAFLYFDDTTGRTVELDYRGTAKDVGDRYATASRPRSDEAEAPRGPGRPRLGVIAREVTLLPRVGNGSHRRPAARPSLLRRLVEDTRKRNAAEGPRSTVARAAYRFMSTLAGNLPGFEEATRTLFAGNPDRFSELTRHWPADVATYAQRLAEGSFSAAVS